MPDGSNVKQKPLLKKVSWIIQVGETFASVHCDGSGDLSKVSSGPPVQFLDPPEQVEVRVGQQARLRCEFRSRCVPVACCWIYNKDKVYINK